MAVISEDLSVDIDDSDFRRYFAERKDFKRAIEQLLARIGTRGEGIMMRHAPADRGFLRSKISARMISATRMTIAPRDVPYADIPITGTYPFTPPLDPIKRWARRHGLEGGAVWHNIRTSGIQSAEESKYRVDYAKETAKELKRPADRLARDTISKWVRRT